MDILNYTIYYRSGLLYIVRLLYTWYIQQYHTYIYIYIHAVINYVSPCVLQRIMQLKQMTECTVTRSFYHLHIL